jgi:hypothetical protein
VCEDLVVTTQRAPTRVIRPETRLAATQTTPIVMVAMDYDPIARGYITGLSQPGGRIAGLLRRRCITLHFPEVSDVCCPPN